MQKWWDLTPDQRNELIAESIMKWKKVNGEWFIHGPDGTVEGPLQIPNFSTSEDSAWIILRTFDSWQVTKMFPLTYRVLISSNKNCGLSKSLPEAICLAALKFYELN